MQLVPESTSSTKTLVVEKFFRGLVELRGLLPDRDIFKTFVSHGPTVATILESTIFENLRFEISNSNAVRCATFPVHQGSICMEHVAHQNFTGAGDPLAV